MNAVKLSTRSVVLVCLGAAALLFATILLLAGNDRVAHSQEASTGAGASLSALTKPGPDATVPPKMAAQLASVNASASSPPVVRAGARFGAAQTYVARAGVSICLITAASDEVGAMGCGPDTPNYGKVDLAARTMFVDDGYLISGVVPDGTLGITVHTKDGDAPASVAGSTFAVATKSTPSSVSWVDVSGASHVHEFVDASR